MEEKYVSMFHNRTLSKQNCRRLLRGTDVFKGTIEACADNVLTLNNEGKYTHVAVDKIIALWPEGDETIKASSASAHHHVHK